MRKYWVLTIVLVFVAGLARSASSADPKDPAPLLAQAGSTQPVTSWQAPFGASTDLTVLLDGLPLPFPEKPYILEGTTMVPLRALAESLGVKVQWINETQEAVCTKGSQEIVLKIGDAQVRVNGRYISLPVKVSRLNDTMMVPLRVFSEAMGFHVSWDQSTRTVHVASPKSPMSIWGFYALGSSSYSSWQDLFADRYPFVAGDPPASHMEGVFLGWYAVNSDGTVTSSSNPWGFQKPDGWPAVLLQARLRGLKCFSMYYGNNYGQALSELLKDPVKREKLALSLASSSGEYEGVLLDLEGLGSSPETQQEDSRNFNLFVDRLRQLLGQKALAVALPPLNGTFRGYDHSHLGEVSDLVVIMAYDYQEPGKPSPVAPWDKIDQAVKLEVAEVPREKILLAVPSYGVVYEIQEGQARVAAKPAGKDIIPLDTGFAYAFDLQNKIPTVFDPRLSCEYAQYTKNGLTYEAFLESPRTFEARINLAKRYGIRGVAIWRLGLLPEGFWTKILDAVEPRRMSIPVSGAPASMF